MKPVKSSIAAIVLAAASLSGCMAMWNNDGNAGSESVGYSANSERYKPDRQWRQDIAKDWDERDRRLSRQRLSEFID